MAASARFSGIGFMFANGIFGVDLDDCGNEIEDYRNGIDDNIVGEFVHSLKSYTEYSVSGKGIHIICKGALPPGGRRRGAVEMYDAARYFIVTGERCAEYKTIRNCTEAIKPLHDKHIGGSSGTAPTTGIKLMLPLNLSDAEIIRMAEDSKQGAMFKDLWAGNYTPYYTSQSEADLTLCNILAFWTAQMRSDGQAFFTICPDAPQVGQKTNRQHLRADHHQQGGARLRGGLGKKTGVSGAYRDSGTVRRSQETI